MIRLFRNPAGQLRAAFSLVEVTLAVGVAGFAFISLLGLLPLGVTTFHNAMDASLGTQIFQRVVNDMQQADFNALAGNQNPGFRYFDEQGNELPEAEQKAAIYHVRTLVIPDTSLPGPGSNLQEVATLVVQIANNPAGTEIPVDSKRNVWKPSSQYSVATHSALVFKNTHAIP